MLLLLRFQFSHHCAAQGGARLLGDRGCRARRWSAPEQEVDKQASCDEEPPEEVARRSAHDRYRCRRKQKSSGAVSASKLGAREGAPLPLVHHSLARESQLKLCCYSLLAGQQRFGGMFLSFDTGYSWKVLRVVNSFLDECEDREGCVSDLSPISCTLPLNTYTYTYMYTFLKESGGTRGRSGLQLPHGSMAGSPTSSTRMTCGCTITRSSG